VRAKHPLFEKCEKANVGPVAPAPSGAPPGQIHSGNQGECCATLRPNAYFFRDARPRPPASDYKCGGKSNIVGQVPSRARKTLTFEALQNSKRGNWHLASTKHLLLIMLEFRFAKFRGISTFQFCETFVTNLVSQLSGSGHLGNLGLSWLGFAWLTWLGLAWLGQAAFGFKPDHQRMQSQSWHHA